MYRDVFLKYLQYEKRFSSHTIEAYQSDLDSFFKYISESFSINNIEEINHRVIRAWLVELMNNGISSRSVNRKISSLKTFFKFLLKEEKIKENPLLKIQSPKIAKKLPVFVEEKKLDLLLDNNFFGTDFDSTRDRVIIEVFYATGIRLSELIKIKNTDIDLYNGTMKVLGKRNKERYIPFAKPLKLLLEHFMKAKEEAGIIESEYFFTTDKGIELYPKLVYRTINKYLSLITTAEKKSPHVLRHTFATHMLNNGADINLIKELLGHANLSATEVYTHNTMEKLKNIYKQAHPRA